MKFDEMVDSLSEKYRLKDGNVFYLLNVAEIRLLINNPRTYFLRYDLQKNDAYKLVDRFLHIQYLRNVRILKEIDSH